MLEFPRWKVIGIVLLILTGIMLAVPSFVPERLTPGMKLPRINLGLDLSGGSHLLLEADASSLLKQRLEQMEETIRTEMRRGDPRIAIGDISTSGNQLSFFVRDVTQVDQAVERVRQQTNGVGVTGQRDWDVRVVDSNRIIMTPTQAGQNDAVDKAMEVATEVVRKRIDELGTREPTIVRQGGTRIVVQVPGLQNPEALKNLLGKTAKLEFKLVDVTASPADLAAGRAPVGGQVLRYPDNPAGGPVIAVKRAVLISGDQLIDAQQGFDQRNNAPVVNIRFDGQGGRRFAKVTQENVNKPFAIILDNQVISAPNINEPILGGQAQISGNFTVESANELAIALRSGKLPVDLKVIEERTVGPQLGADSIRAGVLASVIAVALVVAFMLVTYGRFGVYANLAVIINVFVILGVMSLLNATLTLPGIAGFVLTIGTAVDANVLINERIREERRRGRSVVQAVELGYKEASRTIFEANTVHAISGLIMLALGSGPVKGFAVVLLIGIVTSVFTAVTFTRMLTAGWIRRHRPTEMTI
ncbi:protein translocase subunit SecD [Sphingomonas sp. ID1715]|uniref:protein translocase subunit SecD n=1 Tax=Sphingomonas sp. ID1715 TaxID=1656898 RepID=UPI001487FE11|nr:protein translocase subunit SecD [Sphingomonas sp. ID1715]NNM76163.1 protein translocase subunit SecD [Sphingomonas sp. ID1715]